MKIVLYLVACALCANFCSAQQLRTVHVVVVDSLEWYELLDEMYEVDYQTIRYRTALYDSLRQYLSQDSADCIGFDGSSTAPFTVPPGTPYYQVVGGEPRFVASPLLELMATHGGQLQFFGVESAADSVRLGLLSHDYQYVTARWRELQSAEYDVPARARLAPDAVDSIAAAATRWLVERYTSRGAAQRLRGILNHLEQEVACHRVVAVIGPPYDADLLWRAYRTGRYHFGLRVTKIVP